MNKNKIAVIALIALGHFSIRAAAQDIKFNLNGKIGHYSAPARAYLMYSKGNETNIDSVIMVDGAFSFKSVSDRPEGATLFISSTGKGFRSYDVGYLNLFLEAGNITISSLDSLQQGNVAGGPLNRDYDELKQALKEIDKRIDQVNDFYFNATSEKQKVAGFRDSIINENFRIDNEKKPVGRIFVKKHPSSPVSLAAIEQCAGIHPDAAFAEKTFNKLSASVRLSKGGIAYANKIKAMRKMDIGTVAPDFTLADTSGNSISLHGLKGHYVLIDFWASWCGPCRAQAPALIQVYQTFKNQNFLILGVSADVLTAKREWLKAIHDDQLPWLQVADLNKGWRNAAMTAYGIENIPQNFLITPDGKIAAKNLRGKDLVNKLHELMGK